MSSRAREVAVTDLDDFDVSTACCGIEYSSAVSFHRLDICAALYEDLCKRLYLRRPVKTVAMDLHNFNFFALGRHMQWSLAENLQSRLDVCASVKEDLR